MAFKMKKFSGFKTDPPKVTNPKKSVPPPPPSPPSTNITPPPGAKFTVDKPRKNSTANFLNKYLNNNKKEK
jgi:hypothetical protein